MVPVDGAAELRTHTLKHRDLAVRFRLWLWPWFGFLLLGTFAECTPTFSASFYFLPPPASEVLGSRFVLISSSYPGETSPAAQSPSSGSQEKAAGKMTGKNEGRRKRAIFTVTFDTNVFSPPHTAEEAHPGVRFPGAV